EAAGGKVQGRVAFEGVTFSYLGADGEPNVEPVLSDIDLVAEPGQVVAILGATGSGKSTLVNLLGRFYDVTAGRVTIDGVDVRDVTRASLLETVTPALQQPSLFSGTIEENLQFGAGDGDGTLDVVTAARAAEAAAFHVARRELLRRTAAAPLDRPRACPRPADPRPRRHDQRSSRARRKAARASTGP